MSAVPDIDDHLWQKRHAVLYQVRLSACYFRKRERFFDFWDKTTKVISVLGGTTALAKLADPVLLPYAVFAITGASIISLAFTLSERARRASELARSFVLLEGDIKGIDEFSFEQSDVDSWARRLSVLESTEPATLGALVVLCQNELASAAGQLEKVKPVPLLRKVFAQWKDWSPNSNSVGSGWISLWW